MNFVKQQEGSLCGQHCLNNLLQGAYFSAVDLADLASQLDETERSHLGSNSSSTSHNMDDSGYFSIQVLQKALDIWNICLFSFKSSRPEAVAARNDAHSQKAYICNFQDHWFSIRKIGSQWFNLNSMHSGPELISDTYLSLFLAQLQTDGYSIFVVSGNLPDCDADAILKLAPVEAGKLKTDANSRPVLDSNSGKIFFYHYLYFSNFFWKRIYPSSFLLLTSPNMCVLFRINQIYETSVKFTHKQI